MYDPEIHEWDEEEGVYWLKGMRRCDAFRTVGFWWCDEGFPYHNYRHPRTTQEKRANQDIHGTPRFWRGRRSARVLPTLYDDIHIDFDNLRCWKKKRKRRSQWDKHK